MLKTRESTVLTVCNHATNSTKNVNLVAPDYAINTIYEDGVLVNFNFSGLGPLTGNAYTNNLGVSQYCYTRMGLTPGIDQVYSETFGFSSATSTITWSYQPCDNPTDGGVIGGEQSGCSGYVPLPVANVTLPSGQTGVLEYKWQESTISAVAGRPLQDTITDGFKALLSGVLYSQNSMNHAGFATIFWSSAASGASRALAHGLNERNFSVSLYPALRANAFPVRCLKD